MKKVSVVHVFLMVSLCITGGASQIIGKTATGTAQGSYSVGMNIPGRIDWEAKRIVGLKDATSQSDALKIFLPFVISNKGFITSDAQTNIVTSLQNVFNKAPQTVQSLTSVSALLTEWINSKLLTDAQNGTLSGLITTIKTNLVDLEMKERVSALTEMRDMGTLMSELSQVLTANTGKKINATLQNNIVIGLQKLFNARQKDSVSLSNLQTLLTNWLSCNLLNQNQNTMISSQWLPTITMALQGAGVTAVSGTVTTNTTSVTSTTPTVVAQSSTVAVSQELTTAAGVSVISTNGMSDVDAATVYGINNAMQLRYQANQLDGVSIIFNSFVGRTVSAQVIGAYLQAVQTIIPALNFQDSSLQKRAYDLLQVLLGSPLLSDTQKQLIKTLVLPKVGTSSVTLPVAGSLVPGTTVAQNILAVMQQQSVINQISMLIVITKCIGLQPGVGSVQNAIATAVDQILKRASTFNEEELRICSNFLMLVLASNVLTQDQKKYITTKLLPPLGLSNVILLSGVMPLINNALPAVDIINAIMQSADQVTKIDALKYMIARLDGNLLETNVINACASALQQMYTLVERQDIVLRQKLYGLLSQTQGAAVLTPAQQIHIADNLMGPLEQTAILPSENNIASVVAMVDPIEQIKFLYPLIKGAAGKTISAPLQEKVAYLLNEVSAKVQAFDAGVVTMFIDLLEAIKTSPLLNASQQTTVTATLLPMAKEALSNVGTRVVSVRSIKRRIPKSAAQSQVDIATKATRRVRA
ncbi:MAG: hypothetical protein WCT20_01640 [Candidatus Babeliales bacterium]